MEHDVCVCVCVSYPTRSQMNINGPEEPSVRRDKATDKSSQGNAPRDKSSLYTHTLSHTHTPPATQSLERDWVQMSALCVRWSLWMCVCVCVCLGGLTHRCVHDGMCVCLA